jgi:indolepyruvate ferredoxin oxidoreductase alpha subunit
MAWRSLARPLAVAMKHVDSMSPTLCGFRRVGASCDGFTDDPEMHSSQNEQDNRFGSSPDFLEPSDSQESKDFVRIGCEISEKFDTPVMLRMVTRISHSKSIVEEYQPVTVPEPKFNRDMNKFVMIPANAKKRHVAVLERLQKLQEYSETTPLNFIENHGSEVGIITAGISYQYAKDVYPHADSNKFRFYHEKNSKFVEGHKTTLIIEELEPVMEEQVAAGITAAGELLASRWPWV